jgi:hypothetical protein
MIRKRAVLRWPMGGTVTIVAAMNKYPEAEGIRLYGFGER